MNPFQRRPLGQTALSLTILGFGGSSVGNLFRLVAEEDASSAVSAACRAGIRYFDTAPLRLQARALHLHSRAHRAPWNLGPSSNERTENREAPQGAT